MYLLKKILIINPLKLLKGEWSALSLVDKCQLGITGLGLLGITWTISPELEVLTDIRNRLGPAVEKYDTVYVSKAARAGDVIAIELRKVRTEYPIEYQLWMCTGQESREMVFFGEGFFGREEAGSTLRVSIPDTPSQLLLKVTANDLKYVRYEEWDLYRETKEAETKVIQGDVNCGEV